MHNYFWTLNIAEAVVVQDAIFCILHFLYRKNVMEILTRFYKYTAQFENLKNLANLKSKRIEIYVVKNLNNIIMNNLKLRKL